jgi:hypothetical protein
LAVLDAQQARPRGRAPESRVATVANGALFVGCLWFCVICAVRWIRGAAGGCVRAQ